MSELEELDLLAGEYVLGALDLAERRAVAARRLREPALDAAIVQWEKRLAPLNGAAVPEAPPPEVWPQIEQALAGSPSLTLLAPLRAQVRRWKIAAMTGGALAAGLALALGVDATRRASAPTEFVAVLQQDAASPAFVVSVNLTTRELTARPVAATAPAGKSYELWLINDRLDAPKSLGVIQNADFTSNKKLQAFAPDLVKTSLYAVTIEPEGGSPTGKPSGAPVFAGKLIQATR